jgi:acyl carrier protein
MTWGGSGVGVFADSFTARSEVHMSDVLVRNGTVAPETGEEMLRVVRTVLAEKFHRPLEKITSETQLEEELGMDSLTMIEVNIALEERLPLSMPDMAAPSDINVRTVRDLAAFLAARLAKQRAERRES